MTTSLTGFRALASKKTLTPLALAIALAAVTASKADAQIFVSSFDGNTIGEYGLDGSTINSNFITTGLNGPQDLLLVGNDLVVANQDGGSIGVYDATTGATINSALVTGLTDPDPVILGVEGDNILVGNESGPNGSTIGEFNLQTGVGNPNFISLGEFNGSIQGLALSGNDLFALDSINGRINEYNATSGAVIKNNFITGISDPTSLTLVGNDLFVVTGDNVSEYDITTGNLVKANLISGLVNPFAITASGDDLLVTEQGSFSAPGAPFTTGSVAEYDLSGNLINPALITGLDSPLGVVVQSVPEPSSWALMGLVFVALFVVRYRHNRIG